MTDSTPRYWDVRQCCWVHYRSADLPGPEQVALDLPGQRPGSVLPAESLTESTAESLKQSTAESLHEA